MKTNFTRHATQDTENKVREQNCQSYLRSDRSVSNTGLGKLEDVRERKEWNS